VIYHIETYDVTTVRASTPMYLLARVIKSMGVKMVLSGEGADEIFGGYLYFHKAPDARAFHEETVRKIGRLHQYDCLRAPSAARRSPAAGGLRTPCAESTFRCVRCGGVWLRGRSLKAFTEAAVSDREMAQAADRFPVNPPRNKEEYYYRTIFEECFPSQTAAQCVPSVPSVACSTAEALAWDESFRNLDDPSGRAVQDVHRTARDE